MRGQPPRHNSIVHCHIGLFYQRAALVAADSRFPAQPHFPVDAVPHHPYVDEMGERRHKWVCAGISAVFDNAGTDIGSCSVIEQRYKMIFGVCDSVFHLFPAFVVLPADKEVMRYIERIPQKPPVFNGVEDCYRRPAESLRPPGCHGTAGREISVWTVIITNAEIGACYTIHCKAGAMET